MMKKISENKNAKKIMGERIMKGIPFDQPAELGYRCPICENKIVSKGEFDERLHWGEYEGFLWCKVCNLDIPSCLCVPNLNKKIGTKKEDKKSGIKDATDIFLRTVYDVNCNTKQKILQEIIDFCDERWKSSSHTYLDTYRASRQTSKEIRDEILKIAKREKIIVKCKKLSCQYD